MKVELRNITHAFGGQVVLDNVSLEAEDGELLAILGPSGCGKTTLLQIVAGLIIPDSGQVLFDGKDMTDVPPEKRGVGMVFQNYALFPNMTVAENISFGLMVRGKKRSEMEGRVEELLELVGLSGYEKRRTEQLSGGEMQRVALARALAPGVGLLLLDEPLSALDAKLRSGLRREIRRIQRETGVTAIYVTHDQEEALSISDRVAVMSPARIEQVGTPAEIYAYSGTEFVASFVGEANLLDGTVRGGIIETPIGNIPDSEGAGDGKRVKIIIRPEELKENCEEECLPVTGRIVSMESAGGEVKGILACGETRIKFRRYATEVAFGMGDTVGFFVPFGSIRILYPRSTS